MIVQSNLLRECAATEMALRSFLGQTVSLLCAVPRIPSKGYS